MRRIHERALSELLEREHARPPDQFQLRQASVNGNGLQPGVDPSNREQLHDLMYDDLGKT